MGTELGVAYLSLAISAKGVAKDVRGALGDIESSADRSGKTAGSRLGGGLKAGIGLGIKAVGGLALGVAALAAKGGITRALAIEGAQKKLEGLGHSAQSVTGIMGNALASVKGTAYGLGDAATVAASLTAAGVKQGAQLESALKTVADTAAISGRSLADVGTIFGSVAARGKLMGDDMMQLTSSGVPVLQLLGKHLGKTSAEVSAMVSSGKIDFATFQAAMEKGLGGAALKSGETFQGAMANVYAALSRLGALVATPALGALKVIFNAVTPAIDAVTAALKPLAESLGPKLEAATQSGVTKVAGMFTAVGAAASGLLPMVTPVVQQITAAFSEVGKGIDFGSLLTAGLQIASAFSPLGIVFKSLAPLLPQIAQMFSQIAQQGLATMVPLVTQLAPMFAQLSATLISAGTGIAAALLPVIMQLVQAALPVLGQVIAAVVPVVMQLVQAFMPILPMVTQLVGSLLPPLAQAIMSLLPAIMPLVGAVMQFVQALLPLVGIVVQLVGSLIPPLVAVIQALLPPIISVVAAVAGALVPIFQAAAQIIQTLMPIVAALVGVIGTIVGAVAPVVAIIAGALIGVLASLIGVVGTVLGAIARFVSGAIAKVGEFASAVGRKIGEAVKFFQELPGKAVSALSGMAGKLAEVGRQMIQGLIDGIQAMAESVWNAARSVVEGAINAAKSALRIQSPSKVFRGIGRHVTNGLALGITDKAGAASSAISKVVAAVVKAANDAPKKLRDAAKKTAKAVAGMLNPQKTTHASWWKSAGAASKTTDQMLKSLTASGKWTKAATASMKKSTLADFAKARETLAGRIKDATTELKRRVDESNQLRDKVASSITGEMDLAKAATQVTYTKHSDAKGNTWYTQSQAGFSGIAAHVKALAAKAKTFAGKLKDLIKAGFPAGLVQEVAGMGTDAGISVATALLGASKAEQGELIRDYTALTKSAGQAGQYVADQMYKAGIDAQKGLVAGLMADDAKLAKAAKALADKLTAAVKKALGIKSPSRVFRDQVGLMAAAGLAEGLDRGQALVDTAAASLIDPAIANPSWQPAGAGDVYQFAGTTFQSGDLTPQQQRAIDTLIDMLTSGRRMARAGV